MKQGRLYHQKKAKVGPVPAALLGVALKLRASASVVELHHEFSDPFAP